MTIDIYMELEISEISSNEIDINLNSAQGVCFFNTTQSTYALPDNGGIVTIPVQNNLGPFNVPSFSPI